MRHVAALVFLSAGVSLSLEAVAQDAPAICPTDQREAVANALGLHGEYPNPEEEFLRRLSELGFRYEQILTRRTLRKCGEAASATFSR